MIPGTYDLRKIGDAPASSTKTSPAVSTAVSPAPAVDDAEEPWLTRTTALRGMGMGSLWPYIPGIDKPTSIFGVVAILGIHLDGVVLIRFLRLITSSIRLNTS